jgi:hypothetical protein
LPRVHAPAKFQQLHLAAAYSNLPNEMQHTYRHDSGSSVSGNRYHQAALVPLVFQSGNANPIREGAVKFRNTVLHHAV